MVRKSWGRSDWIKDNKFASSIVDRLPYGSAGLNAADWVADKASDKINDGWKGYADLIVLTLATKVSYGLAHIGKANVESYFIDRPGGDLAKATFKKGGTFSGVKIEDKDPYSWTDACQAMCRATNNCKTSTFITATKVCIVKSDKAGAGTLYDRGVTTDNPYGAAVVRDHTSQ